MDGVMIIFIKRKLCTHEGKLETPNANQNGKTELLNHAYLSIQCLINMQLHRLVIILKCEFC